MKIDWLLVQDPETLTSLFTKIDPTGPVAVDTETTGLDENAPGAKLLGVSIYAPGVPAFYVPLFHGPELSAISPQQVTVILRQFLASLTCAVGQNYLFDERWLARHLEVEVAFTRDTQILWHLSSAPYVKQSYSLKAAMTDLLHWDKSNKDAVMDSIIANGGDKKNPRFALADLNVLAEYAALDAYATYCVYDKLKGFFDENAYWAFHDTIISYKRLIEWNTREGVPTDRTIVERFIESRTAQLQEIEEQLYKLCSTEIAQLEAKWRDERAASYKTEAGRLSFISDTTRHARFNFDSPDQLAELFYDVIGERVKEKTPKGKRQANKVALKQMEHPAAALLLKHSKVGTAITYAESYLKHIAADGRIHPSFNVTGTVSGRLSGREPNMQNLPFKEGELMQAFKVPEGRVGIYADLTSIEPFFTALLSEDPTLLKVYRDRKGDIYLDAALALFPENKELAAGYNPNEKPTDEVKSLFKRERNISKVVHLASQYGAGPGKIQKILSQDNIEISLPQAKRLHEAYWKKFAAVKRLEGALYAVYRKEGQIKTPFGRIVRLPDFWCKDLLNRVIQSCGHDALMAWVFEIHRLGGQRKLDMVPFLLDVHDATGWHVPEGRYEEARLVFEDALTAVNEKLSLEFPFRAQILKIHSLADVKE